MATGPDLPAGAETASSDRREPWTAPEQREVGRLSALVRGQGTAKLSALMDDNDPNAVGKNAGGGGG